MEVTAELLKQGKPKELWERCCGFIDLNMDQFMAIQHQLLLEQIELLKKCELGNRLMRGAQPCSVEEFRQQVPVTTYADYAPYLLEKREDVLPEKPLLWQRTSGRSGEYPCKWVPVTRRMYDEMGDFMLGLFLFAVEIVWFIGLPIAREGAEWWRRRDAFRLNRNLLFTGMLVAGGVWAVVVPVRARAPVRAREVEPGRARVPRAALRSRLAKRSIPLLLRG